MGFQAKTQARTFSIESGPCRSSRNGRHCCRRRRRHARVVADEPGPEAVLGGGEKDGLVAVGGGRVERRPVED